MVQPCVDKLVHKVTITIYPSVTLHILVFKQLILNKNYQNTDGDEEAELDYASSDLVTLRVLIMFKI